MQIQQWLHFYYLYLYTQEMHFPLKQGKEKSPQSQHPEEIMNIFEYSFFLGICIIYKMGLYNTIYNVLSFFSHTRPIMNLSILKAQCHFSRWCHGSVP